MWRNLHRFGLSTLLFAAGWPLGALEQQTPAEPPGFTFKAQVNLVLLDVSVRDSAGAVVTGLPKDAFTVLEDGRPQTITEFADRDFPVTAGLIVDNSGSMRVKKPEVITAALAFVQSSNPFDEMFVVNFNDRVRFGLPSTTPFCDDVPQLRKALVETDPAGRTALYDAIIAGLRHLEMGRRDKKALVVVGDGGDNVSAHSFNDVLTAVLESRATIYAVGLFDPDDPDRNPGVLKKLARISGGAAYLPPKLDDVVPICRQIARDIRTRYTIGYVPSGLERRGARHITVRVSSAGREKLTARTRTVYVVPGSAPTASAERRR